MATDTIDTLNNLIETSKDGEYGFFTSAEYAKASDLKQLLMQRAKECREAATQLQVLVTSLGGKAEDSGSFSGAAHRGWVALKGSLSDYTDLDLLEEAERGEDIALKNYRTAIGVALPAPAKALVERQLEGVTRNHAQLRQLRDQARRTTG